MSVESSVRLIEVVQGRDGKREMQCEHEENRKIEDDGDDTV